MLKVIHIIREHNDRKHYNGNVYGTNNEEYSHPDMTIAMASKELQDSLLTKMIILTLVDYDFKQYVKNDMSDFLCYCSESEVIKNEFLLKVK